MIGCPPRSSSPPLYFLPNPIIKTNPQQHSPNFNTQITSPLNIFFTHTITPSSNQTHYKPQKLTTKKMGLELWETLKEAITVYTGLSPTTFFTVVALSLAFYHAVFGLFGSSNSSNNHQNPRSFDEERVPLPPPVQLGEITEDELKQFDGSDDKKPLLMAIKGQIYDVSQSRMFYGPGGPYALFAGKDASRALAKMSFEDNDLTGDISGLGPFELEALQDWEYKFMSKYVKVGTIKKDDSVSDGPSSTEPSESANATDREAPKQEEDVPSEKPVGETVETSSVGDADKKEE